MPPTTFSTSSTTTDLTTTDLTTTDLMRDRRPEMQHIEVINLDDPSWWDDSPNDVAFVDPPSLDERAQRRRGVAFVAALALAVAVAAIVVISSEDEPTPAPPTAGHFIIDSPALRPYSADIVTPSATNASYTLFANGDPTKPWISLQVYRSSGEPVAALDSSRRQVDGHNLITPRDQRSMTTIDVDLGDGWQAKVQAFSILDHALVRFADSLKVIDGERGNVLFDEEILADNNLMATQTANWADELLYGTVATEMRAVTPEGVKVTLRESTGDVDTRPATLAYFTSGRVQGSDGFTAETLIANGDAIVTWAAAGRLLSLTGPLATTELLAISRTVRMADETEWRQLVYGLHPDYRLGDFAEIASSAPDLGPPWSSGFQLAASGGRTEYLWWWTLPGTRTSASAPTRTDLAAGPGNETIVVGDATYVFVWVPVKSDQIFASVRASDGSVVKLQLRLIFADVPVRLAATRIDVPGPVEISTS